ncbi:transposase [Rhizobium sullae]|uniref:Transposase n=1 Tax=Rhizobium sullae TaxID=50338 RepID=A0A4V6P0N6_RHISU|nr:transposase [Rhizobium sullae]
MKKQRFTEEQIIGVLKEQEAGAKAADLCRKHGISEATFYNWKAKYGGMEVSEPAARRSVIGPVDRRRSICERSCVTSLMSDGVSATGGYSSCFGETESRPGSIAYTVFIARKGFPFASERPVGVLSARVRRSWSKRRPMPAGRWISSTTSLPAVDASGC